MIVLKSSKPKGLLSKDISKKCFVEVKYPGDLFTPSESARIVPKIFPNVPKPGYGLLTCYYPQYSDYIQPI